MGFDHWFQGLEDFADGLEEFLLVAVALDDLIVNALDVGVGKSHIVSFTRCHFL